MLNSPADVKKFHNQYAGRIERVGLFRARGADGYPVPWWTLWCPSNEDAEWLQHEIKPNTFYPEGAELPHPFPLSLTEYPGRLLLRPATAEELEPVKWRDPQTGKYFIVKEREGEIESVYELRPPAPGDSNPNRYYERNEDLVDWVKQNYHRLEPESFEPGTVILEG